MKDNGPSEDEKAGKAARKQARTARMPMEIEGVLRQVLHGPKGDPRGLLLEDGRAGRFPPHAAKALTGLLQPGTRLLLRGDGLAMERGTVLAVRGIGTSPDDLRQIEAEPAKDKHEKRPKHDKPGKPHRSGPAGAVPAPTPAP